MNRELHDRLDAYIKQYYMEPSGSTPACQDIPVHGLAKESLSPKQAASLREIMEELGASFHEKLFQLIKNSGMTDAEVYKLADIDRKLFSKIRSNPAYHPRKETVIALAVALKLDLDGTEDLMSRAGYALSPSSREDLVVKFFIENRIYDIDAIHEAIQEFR